jgi:arginine decarboxylase
MTRSIDHDAQHRFSGHGGRADQPDRRSSPLMIQMSTGVGAGPTPLAAFDAALRQIGVGDFNLIRLSSVIPSGSRIRHVERVEKEARWGDRLYCVYAEQHSTTPGQGAAAGVGWVLKDDDSGSGLFVEHHGSTEQEVSTQIRSTLGDMTAGRGGGFDAPQMSIATAVCEQQPVCVISLAAYSAGWWGVQ